MITKITKASRFTLVTVSLFIGFIGGIVFTVYQSPSIISKLPATSQQEPNQPDLSQHISHLKESLDEDPNNADNWLQLANAYYKVQDYPKSIESYLKAIPLADNKSLVYQDIGIAYRGDGQFEKSIEAFEKAFAANPDNLQALFNKGVVQYHDLDDEVGAKKTWQRVADIKPDFPLSTGQTIQQLIEKMK